ncbi:MAG: hypothetical protein ACR2KL_10745 [Nocardioidaceae bacterium]
MGRHRFEGQIAGVGTASGVRLVIGRWVRSPWGPFADVMVEQADDHRVLLAPDDRVAEFVGATYSFDEVCRTPVRVTTGPTVWRVDAGPLQVCVDVGTRPVIGSLLRLVPRRVAGTATWAGIVDPVARIVLRGVRTRGSAGAGRREWYAATDLHRVTAVAGTWRGKDLGDLRPVRPPVHFGFGSTPAMPSVTDVVTTVADDDCRR